MDEFFREQIEMQILDFATDKRAVWEREHKLYSVVFELTPRCNFNCVHCYLHDHHCEKELSHQEIIDIIDLLYEKEVLFLTLTGGDVFMRKDFLDIYLYAKKKGFLIEVFTNGALINDKVIDVFAHYPPLLVDISLYGSNEETYEKVTGVPGMFSRVMSNIQALLSAGVRVSLKTPALNIYYSELPAMRAIAEEFDVPFRTGFEIFPSIDNESFTQKYQVPLRDMLAYEFDDFEKNPRIVGADPDVEKVDIFMEKVLFRCKLGRASCVIDYEGRMCPCMSFRHKGQKLSRENFDSVWGSFSEYPKMKASASYKCLTCKAYDYCDICPAMMQFVYGDLEHTDEHFCECARARYLHYEQGCSLEQSVQGCVQ